MLSPPTSITLFVTSSSDSNMEVSLFAASYFQNSASKRACQSTRFFGLSFPMATSSEWKNPISGLVFCSCSSHDSPSIVYLASQLEKLVWASLNFQGDSVLNSKRSRTLLVPVSEGYYLERKPLFSVK